MKFPGAVGEEVELARGPLHGALNDQDTGADECLAVGLEDVRAEDDVDQAPLVLQGEEDEALGGGGRLAHGHQAGHAEALPLPLFEEVSADLACDWETGNDLLTTFSAWQPIRLEGTAVALVFALHGRA